MCVDIGHIEQMILANFQRTICLALLLSGLDLNDVLLVTALLRYGASLGGQKTCKRNILCIFQYPILKVEVNIHKLISTLI